MTITEAVEKLRQLRQRFVEIEISGDFRGEHLGAEWHTALYRTRATEGALYLPAPSDPDIAPLMGYVNLCDTIWGDPAHHHSGRQEEFSTRMVPAAEAFRELAREAGRVISRIPELTSVVVPITCAGQRPAIDVEFEIWWFAALFLECSEPIQEHDYNDGGPEFDTKLKCNVFAASETVCDKFIALLSDDAKTRIMETELESQRSPTISATTPGAKRFCIALSFPGERRDFVRQVAERLADSFGRERILYDQWYEAEFARLHLAEYLPNLYHKESELIAVFLSAEYRNKEWCGLEWEVILDLKKKRFDDRIMPLRFDDTEIPGLHSTDGYISIGTRTPADIADRILQRWESNNRSDS